MMKQLRSEAGFSLVELLAVVLILAVLSAVAVPLYLNTRREAAERTCRANIAAIAAAESAYALRFGHYCGDNGTAKATETDYATGAAATGPTGGLIGAPEGLASEIKCPLDGTTSYDCTVGEDNSCTIKCGNSAHAHTIVLKPAGNDAINQPASSAPASGSGS